MREFIQDLPKAELHVHLEGSLEPGTLLEIRPSLTREEIIERYQYDSFERFLKNFGWVARHLEKPSDYGIAARDLIARLAAQNVRYAEITLAAGVVLWKHQDLHAVHAAVREAAAGSTVEVHWIWDAVRQWGVDAALEVARQAVQHSGDGVVAFGLGGDEASLPAADFEPVFHFAQDHGLHAVCHAGEILGASSVREACAAGAERIGHGIGSAQDEELMRELADRGIPLEICISSNVRTGAIPRLEDHPVRKLFDAGVPVILNTDDPPMFHCTLNGEYEIAARVFGFSPEELRLLADNGFQYRFRK